MNIRSTRLTVAFPNARTLSGYPGELPARHDQGLVEDDLLRGLSFGNYRRTATSLTIRGSGIYAGRFGLRAMCDREL